MTELSVLEEGHGRRRDPRRRPRRRRRRAAAVLAVVVLALVALLTVSAGRTAGPRSTVLRHRFVVRVAPRRRVPAAVAPSVQSSYGRALAPPAEQVTTHQSFHVTSAILFNVWDGRVLWEQNPGVRLPIASLTKMMTALVVLAHSKPSDQVLITPQAVHFSGSGVGNLPLGKQVPLLPLLFGLLLPSGNDAAIALAQHVAGSEEHFVDMMNAQVQAMGLGCSHFASASGIVDQDNYSCTTDLAVLAHAILEQPFLAHIVSTASADFPFPIKGGHLYLFNNNPLLIMGYPGTDGVKTGYTQAAGKCLVATARRGGTWLGVILLHSVDPGSEAVKLLNAGFAKLGPH